MKKVDKLIYFIKVNKIGLETVQIIYNKFKLNKHVIRVINKTKFNKQKLFFSINTVLYCTVQTYCTDSKGKGKTSTTKALKCV